MKKIFAILFCLIAVISVKSQTEGSLFTQSVASAGDMRCFFPIGWSTASASKKVLVYGWPGSGATTIGDLEGEGMMKKIVSGWNGKKVIAPGDTVYYAFISTVIGNANCNNAVRHSDYIWSNWLLADSTSMVNGFRTVFYGYSLGGGEMSKPLTGFCFGGESFDRVQARYKKIVTSATGTWQNVFDLSTILGKRCYWGIVDTDDPLSANTDDVYNEFLTSPGATSISVKKSNPDLGNNVTAHPLTDEFTFQDGTDATNDVLWWAYDTLANVVALTKITGIHHRDIIEVTGNGIQYQPHKMFDESFDPDNGISGVPADNQFKNATNPIYHSSWVNNSWSYVVNLRGSFNLQKLYYYVPNSFFGDTLVVWSGGFGPSDTWTRVATVFIPAGTNGWQSVTLSGTSSFLRFDHKGKYSVAFGIAGIADIREFAIYGDLIGGRTAAPADSYTGAMRPKPTIKNLSGRNFQLGKVQNWLLKYINSIRQGNEQIWFSGPGSDLDYPNRVYNMDHFNAFATTPEVMEFNNRDSLVKILGKKYWNFFIFSNDRYVADGGIRDGFRTDRFNQDITKPENYKAEGDLHYHRAGMFGAVAVDTNNLHTIGVPKFSGLDTDTIYEPNNEGEGNWRGVDTNSASGNKYIPPIAEVVHGQMSLDGYEGRFGPRLGVKAADPNAKLIQSGIAGYDTSLAGSRYEMGSLMRTDGQPIYKGGFNFHYYPQKDGRGKHPILDSMVYAALKVVDYCYRIDPTLPIYITEAGGDANPNSPFGYQHTDGYTDRENQAWNNLWILYEYAEAGVDFYQEYNAVWNAPEADAGGYATSFDFATFDATLGAGIYRKTKHFVRHQNDSIMWNYRFDSRISYGWQTHTLRKFVSSTNGDSAIYVSGFPNQTGMTHSGTFFAGSNKVVKKVVFNRTGYNPTVTDATYNAGTGLVADTWDNQPTIYIVTSLPSTPAGNKLKNTKFSKVKQGTP
jgi:hypothetical protein